LSAKFIGRDILRQRAALIEREASASARVSRIMNRVLKEWRADSRRLLRINTPTSQAELRRRQDIAANYARATAKAAASSQETTINMAGRVYATELAKYSRLVSQTLTTSTGVTGNLSISFSGVSERQVAAAIVYRLPGTSRGEPFATIGSAAELHAREAVAQSIADNSGLDNLAKQLQKIAGVSTNSAKSLARTSIMAASNTAASVVYRRTPTVVALRWNATYDSRTCSLCASRHGMIFRKGDEPPIPAHINCRCVYIPIFQDADLNSAIAANELPDSIAPDSGAFSDWLLGESDETRADFFPSILKRAIFELRIRKLEELVTPEGSAITDAEILGTITNAEYNRIRNRVMAITGQPWGQPRPVRVSIPPRRER